MSTCKERSEIEDEYKWDLGVMYRTKDEFEADFSSVKEKLPAIKQFQGKLGDPSGEPLARLFALMNELLRQTDKLAVYTGSMLDQDTRDDAARELKDRVSSLSVALEAELSWVAPEVLAIADDALASIQGAAAMEPYARQLEMLLHDKPHTLGPAEEHVLALASDALRCAEQTFGALNNADMKFPMVKGADGASDVELTHASYGVLLRAPDRGVRRGAFEALYDRYDKVKNTLVALIDGVVRAHVFRARARRYSSALEAALDADCVPVSVYTSLIGAMHESLGAFYRYVQLRRQRLGVDGPLDMYDHHVPIVPDYNPSVPYGEAQEWVREAVRPLGAEYGELLEQALAPGARWIDVYETRGKRSGAYSSGCYDSPPYVLLNYAGTLNDAFTLAHELGHSMHKQLSKKQPYQYSQYRIFVAEIASTVNECLLSQCLMRKARAAGDRAMQVHLLNQMCDDFRTTAFRQVMFAEFEMLIHDRVWQGEALTLKTLCDTYYDLNAKYFGPDVVADRRIALEWSRIPHFYYNFYVYKYATSLCVAYHVAERIGQGDSDMVRRYIDFLSAGCSRDPLDLIREHLGIDLTKTDYIRTAVGRFTQNVEDLAALLQSDESAN